MGATYAQVPRAQEIACSAQGVTHHDTHMECTCDGHMVCDCDNYLVCDCEHECACDGHDKGYDSRPKVNWTTSEFVVIEQLQEVINAARRELQIRGASLAGVNSTRISSIKYSDFGNLMTKLANNTSGYPVPARVPNSNQPENWGCSANAADLYASVRSQILSVRDEFKQYAQTNKSALQLIQRQLGLLMNQCLCYCDYCSCNCDRCTCDGYCACDSDYSCHGNEKTREVCHSDYYCPCEGVYCACDGIVDSVCTCDLECSCDGNCGAHGTTAISASDCNTNKNAAVNLVGTTRLIGWIVPNWTTCSAFGIVKACSGFQGGAALYCATFLIENDAVNDTYFTDWMVTMKDVTFNPITREMIDSWHY